MKAWTTLKNFFISIANGTLMLRLKLTKHFVKILGLVAVCFAFICVSLVIDESLRTVKKNNDILTEQKREIISKTFEFDQINRRLYLDERLEQMGSKVRKPSKPAIKLD